MRIPCRISTAIAKMACLLIAPASGALAQGESSIETPFPTPSESIQGRIQQSGDQQKLYRESCNSVVQIEISDPFGATNVSGFFVDDDGLIATVVATNRSPDTITVTWQERGYPARLLAIDERTRLALLKIDAEMTPALMLSRDWIARSEVQSTRSVTLRTFSTEWRLGALLDAKHR